MKRKDLKVIIAIVAVLVLVCAVVAVVVGFFVSRGIVDYTVNQQPPDPSLFQVCLSAPASPGCGSCIDEGLKSNPKNLCTRCEDQYLEVSVSGDASVLSEDCK
jgi:hypothetical protein